MKTTGFMHSLNAEQTPKIVALPLVVVIGVVSVLLGTFGAYMMTKGASSLPTNVDKGTAIQTDKASGVMDKKTFKDSAEGIMREGGVEGEGNFHLERSGGASQNAYLTSSTVDLSKYIGKKVTVWGQTFQGQKAGWLMDVGLVEIK
ncbi:MAG: hypothetical protein WAV30_03375 [Microgenomates group bacterium]